MNNYEGNEIVNIGVGEDLSIKELAEKVKATVGFTGALRFDTSKPDGTPRKLVDVTKINALGWKATTALDEGLKKAYDWFLQTEKELVRK